jgi:hypothetical protein
VFVTLLNVTSSAWHATSQTVPLNICTCGSAAAAVNVKSVQQLGSWKLYRAAKAMAVLAATEVRQQHNFCDNLSGTCCLRVCSVSATQEIRARLQCSSGVLCVNRLHSHGGALRQTHATCVKHSSVMVLPHTLTRVHMPQPFAVTSSVT